MARIFRYHVYHRAAHDAGPAWGSTSISVPKIQLPPLTPSDSPPGVESIEVYSLKLDMEQLRKEGAAKGIVDAGTVSLGKSTEGRELYALKVGTGSTHKVLFTGCHHAREWISVEIPYLVAEYLIQNYKDPPTNDKEKRIKHLLMNREIWFVPMANPDGHEYTTRTNRWWRPNRKAHAMLAGSSVRSPANGGTVSWPASTYTGVDLNRNYATANWGTETFHLGSPRTSRDPRDGGLRGIWCGTAASGEKESKLIDSLIKAKKFRCSITYHNFSQLLLYPDAASADTYLQWVGNGMDKLIDEKGNPYDYQSGSSLYNTSGDLMDFTYETVSGRPTYTPELRPKDTAPRAKFFSGLPSSEIKPCFEENLPAALALINSAGHDTPAKKKTVDFTSAKPKPGVTQVVRNSWEVFKLWTP